MKVGSNTFDSPYFQMVLKSQQFSPIIGTFGSFAKNFGLVKKRSNSDFQSQFSMSDFFKTGIICLIAHFLQLKCLGWVIFGWKPG